MKSSKSIRRTIAFVSLAFAMVLAGGLPVSAAAPTISSVASAEVPENTSSAVTLVDVNASAEGSTIVYSIVNAVGDFNKFEIDPSTGVLTFATGFSPNFEIPQDTDANNVYVVQVRATNTVDDPDSSTDQTIQVTVTDVVGTIAETA